MTGTLLLLTQAISGPDGTPVRPFLSRAPADACFALETHREQQDSYVGIEQRGIFVWRFPVPDTLVHITLYHSPDAGYEASLRPRGDRLIGTGTSWGAGVVEIHAPLDSVVAVWEGPASAADCKSLLGS